MSQRDNSQWHQTTQHSPYLQGSLAHVHQPLNEVIFCFGHQFLDFLPALREGDGVISEVIQDGAKVLSTSVYEDPAFFVSQHLHSPTEHGLEHSVMPGEGPHCGVVQGAAYIELNILVAQPAALEATYLRLGP